MLAMNKIIKKYEEKLKDAEYYNEMSPFPVYDTEYIQIMKKKLKQMKNDTDYDKLPVAACKYCNSLHVITDELGNDVCMKCGSINDIIMYDNIYEHEKHKES